MMIGSIISRDRHAHNNNTHHGRCRLMKKNTLTTTTIRVLIVLVVLTTNNVVEGWGKEGHEIIADIAYARLTPTARSAVDTILHYHSDDDDSSSSSSSSSSPLAKVASWADEIRHLSKARWTSSLHYADVDESSYDDECHARSNDGCSFVYERDCDGERCVAGSIVNYTMRLDYQFHHHNDDDDDHDDDGNGGGSDDVVGVDDEMVIVMEQQQQRQRQRQQPSSFSGDSSSGTITTAAQQQRLRRKVLRTGSTTTRYYNDDDDEDDDAFGSNTSRESLMFVTHFIGDIHQPLHVGRKGDRGGNDIHVTFQSSGGDSGNNDADGRVMRRGSSSSRIQHLNHKSSNLHSIWDTDMIERTIRDDYSHSQSDYTSYLLKYIEDPAQSDLVKEWLTCHDGRTKDCTTIWAKESIGYALYYAYANVNDDDDDDGVKEVVSGDTLGDDYYNSRIGIVNLRLAMGGVRLASTLNSILDDNDSDDDNDEHYDNYSIMEEKEEEGI